ncbi:hypothetical protein NM688_g148 [Phlebia brevispora]|uniref:Uncharacterized protein n=1 Tax=Phlebia brevispora TaxID=194682 RepID=A0ACC1TF54_9APHY|nr:hypothetical protein NM688_g148 [Phlebia brevispora]
MAVPIQWLDETFNSRAKAEALLRPDLESGLLTQHDFELATTFLPGPNRYWPHVTGGAATIGTVAYGRYYRKLPWGPGRTFLVAGAAYCVGTLLGQLQRARLHYQFSKSLDNPRAFAQALQNVNVRIGGREPLPWTLPQVKEIPQPTVNTSDIHGDTTRPEDGDSIWAQDVPQSLPPPTPPRSFDAAPQSAQAQSSENAPRFSSRWDEIRAANVAGAKQSSWDALRQRHERAAAGDVTQPTNFTSALNQRDRERAEEQARFDAILDAERKIAGG